MRGFFSDADCHPIYSSDYSAKELSNCLAVINATPRPRMSQANRQEDYLATPFHCFVNSKVATTH